MRISDWSSDVCSSDLGEVVGRPEHGWGQGPVVGWADAVTEVVGEAQTVGLLGIPGDVERAVVVQPVVERAQADEVRGDREAAVLAVHDVVHLDPALLRAARVAAAAVRSEEHTSELQSLMRSSYAVFCL